jgi:S1-C subfamily serine protease
MDTEWPTATDEQDPGPSGAWPAGPELGPEPRRRRGRPGLRLGPVIIGTALLAAVGGGLAGSYLEARATAPGTDPGYSLPAVPPAVTDRPANSVAGIAARVLPSVVMIKVNDGEGTGTGFVIRGGYIVTDNHVITLDGRVSHASLQIVLANGTTVKAAVIGADPYSDIAVVKPVRPLRLPALALGNSASVRVGDPVVAVGSPLGLAGTVTSGIVSAVGRPVQPTISTGTGARPRVYFDAIQTDAPINPGNSGGPLVNGQAQVIGINAAIDTLGGNPLNGGQGGSIGLGFAIPVNQARTVTTELIRTGRARHAVIGALLNPGYPGRGAQIAARLPGNPAPVSPGGPAARAGLHGGDVITRFGGQVIVNSASLLDAVRSVTPGTRVTVKYRRNGISRRTALTVASAASLRQDLRREGVRPEGLDGLH